MSAVLQWAAAIVVLVAFTASQAGRWSVASLRYLWCNTLGGTGLALAAVLSHQWGFVLLEGVWGLVAARGLAQQLARRAADRGRGESGGAGATRR